MIKLLLSATCASFLMIPMSFAAESKSEAQPSAVANCGGCEKKKDCDKKDGCDKNKPEGTLAGADCGKCKKGEEKKEEKAEGTLAYCGKCKKHADKKEKKQEEEKQEEEAKEGELV